ncbi:hypothetical protein TNCV_2642321 [Trichonephila clavipes]|nr:hypothetical protein TNCV_2642321 [Trichonephila clavipes]
MVLESRMRTFSKAQYYYHQSVYIKGATVQLEKTAHPDITIDEMNEELGFTQPGNTRLLIYSHLSVSELTLVVAGYDA